MADCSREDTGGFGEVALRIVLKRLEQRCEVVGRKVSVDYFTGLPGPDPARTASMATRIGAMELWPCDEP